MRAASVHPEWDTGVLGAVGGSPLLRFGTGQPRNTHSAPGQVVQVEPDGGIQDGGPGARVGGTRNNRGANRETFGESCGRSGPDLEGSVGAHVWVKGHPVLGVLRKEKRLPQMLGSGALRFPGEGPSADVVS